MKNIKTSLRLLSLIFFCGGLIPLTTYALSLQTDLNTLVKMGTTAAQVVKGDPDSASASLDQFDALNSKILKSFSKSKGGALLLLEAQPGETKVYPWALFQSMYGLALSRAIYAAAQLNNSDDDNLADEYSAELAGVLNSFDNLMENSDGVRSQSADSCPPTGYEAIECYTLYSRGTLSTNGKTWFRNPPNQIFSALRNLYSIQVELGLIASRTDYWPQSLDSEVDVANHLHGIVASVLNYMAFAPAWNKAQPNMPPALGYYMEARKAKKGSYLWAFYEWDLGSGVGYDGDLTQNCFYQFQDVIEMADLFESFDTDPTGAYSDSQIQQAENYLKRFKVKGKRLAEGAYKYPSFLYQAFLSSTDLTIVNDHQCPMSVSELPKGSNRTELEPYVNPTLDADTLQYLNEVFGTNRSNP